MDRHVRKITSHNHRMTVESVNDMLTLKKANVGTAAGLTGDGVNDAPNVGIAVEGAHGHRVPGGLLQTLCRQLQLSTNIARCDSSVISEHE